MQQIISLQSSFKDSCKYLFPKELDSKISERFGSQLLKHADIDNSTKKILDVSIYINFESYQFDLRLFNMVLYSL